METSKQKAIESVVNRLVKEVDSEFEKGNNPYNFEERIIKVMHGKEE
jgi:hypothetical protein